jgi:hypothetical protein
MSEGPKALRQRRRRHLSLATLAGDISARRLHRAGEMLKEQEFKRLVKMHQKDWEHEYEYWNRLNWT